MAIIVDKTAEATRQQPETDIPVVRLAPYPVFPSENPGTPYIPDTLEPAWWNEMPDPSTDWSPASNQHRDYDAFIAANEILREKNPTAVIFEKHESKRHQYANMTYAGVDMVASISMPGQGDYVFADLNTLSVSTHRENFPVRTLGSVNPRGFTSGPRTIAGSMIFSVIDAYVFYKIAQDMYGKSAASLWDDTPAGVYPLADSLPPFDITITFNNEYDPDGAALRIFGIKLIDDSMTMSIDDLVSENTYSFMAQGVAPIHRAKNWKVISMDQEGR